MKLNKKIRWSFSLVGLATIAVIPMSVALVSCNNNSNNDSSLNIGRIQNDFSENMKDPNLAINVDKYIYDKAKISSNQFSSKIQDYNGENVVEKSNNWLNLATKEDIENMLFINFNRVSKFYYDHNNGTTYKESAKKAFFDIKVLKYDSLEKVVNFTLTYYFNELNLNDNFGWENNNINYYEYNQVKITYEFNNIKLIVNDNPNLPTLSIDTNNKDMTIKCINTSYSTSNNQQEAYLKSISSDKNNMTSEEYNNAVDLYSHWNDILLNSVNNFLQINELDWYNIEFNNVSSSSLIPFLGDLDPNELENPALISNFIGYEINYSNFICNYSRNSYSLPMFIIANFDNNNSTIEILNK